MSASPLTALATYENGALHLRTPLSLPEHTQVQVQVWPMDGPAVLSRVCIDAVAARRSVNRYVLDNISYLMGAEQPELTEQDGPIWRVPIVLTYPSHGVVGRVGSIDVNAETGELMLVPETIEQITQHARTLAASLSLGTAPTI